MHNEVGGLVSCVIQMKKHRSLLSEILTVRDRWRNIGVGERIILKYILNNRMSRSELDSSGSDRVQCRFVVTKQFSCGFYKPRECLG
jgi:hypothetical protein